MKTPIAAFTPEQGNEILAAVRWLRSTGLMTQAAFRQPPRGNDRPPLHVLNDSGEVIPAFACMQITGVEVISDRVFVKVDKPADDGPSGDFVFNGPHEIQIGGAGQGHIGPIVRSLSETVDLEAGMPFGPRADSWKLEKGGTLLTAFGADDQVFDNVIKGMVNEGSRAMILKTITSIGARSGDTPGTGTGKPYWLNADGDLEELKDSADESQALDLFHIGGGSVSSGAFIQAKRISGHLCVDMEDCA